MSTATATTELLKGGEWLVKESAAAGTFTPEDFQEEQLMVRDMCNQFLDAEVYPNLDRIDNLEPGLMKSLDYGKGYRYAHDEADGVASGMECLPPAHAGRRFYQPTERGLEARIKQRLAEIRKETG